MARISTGAPTLHSVLDDPVLVLLLGLGTTAGVVAMALVLVPAVHRSGGDFGWHWEPRHPAVRKLARLSGWTVGYVAANQIALLVVLVLAYRSTGAVSVYLAAFTVYQLPHGLLAVSIMTALAPELARSHQRHDLAGLRHAFAGGLRMLLLVMVPAALGMAVLARPLVHALLHHGRFKHQYVAPTADTLAAFAIGLAAFSVYLYVIRTFTSMQNTRTPFVLNVVENGVNIATAFVLWEWYGVAGLAWSWTLAYTVGAVVSVVTVRRDLGGIEGGGGPRHPVAGGGGARAHRARRRRRRPPHRLGVARHHRRRPPGRGQSRQVRCMHWRCTCSGSRSCACFSTFSARRAARRPPTRNHGAHGRV